MNMGEPPSLLRNELPRGNHWISILLEGTRSNHSAVGATVTLSAGSLRQTNAVMSQSSYPSQNDRRLHFGLGSADKFDGVTVRWPSGLIEQFAGGAADRVVQLREGGGEEKSR